jgi:hypothetical protein
MMPQNFGGNTAPVQSVAFDALEELVAAGSLRGDVKVIDLGVGRGRVHVHASQLLSSGGSNSSRA